MIYCVHIIVTNVFISLFINSFIRLIIQNLIFFFLIKIDKKNVLKLLQMSKDTVKK